MRKFIVAAMVGLFLGTIVGMASAGEAPKASTGACKKVTIVEMLEDGSSKVTVRCEQQKADKPVYGKVR